MSTADFISGSNRTTLRVPVALIHDDTPDSMWLHVPEPPGHDPNPPPTTPPGEEPGREIDLPPLDDPDVIRDPGDTPPDDAPEPDPDVPPPPQIH